MQHLFYKQVMLNGEEDKFADTEQPAQDSNRGLVDFFILQMNALKIKDV